MIKNCSDFLISLQFLYIRKLDFQTLLYFEIYHAEISIIKLFRHDR